LPRDVGVVVVAAGRGERLGGTPKQYREIAGVPMLLRSIRPFVAHPDVERVVVVLRPDDAGTPPPWLAQLAGGALDIVGGRDLEVPDRVGNEPHRPSRPLDQRGVVGCR
jgi:2-C-methyl-D-erythritol 4-phosphate cytidylyltransferase